MIRVRGSVEGFKALLGGGEGQPRQAPRAAEALQGVPATGPVPGLEASHAG